MRSAWIEIEWHVPCCISPLRRAPCGARGLKWTNQAGTDHNKWSRSMRSAWIEIKSDLKFYGGFDVALHAERVD